MNRELTDVQAEFRKGRGTRDQIIDQKRKSSRKATFASLTTLKTLTCGSQQTAENSSRDQNSRPPCLSPEKSVCWSRRNS